MGIETGPAWGPLDLVGGLPCLDFANTAGGHSKIREVERIPTYQDVINWAEFAAVVTSGEARRIVQAAKAKPGMAARQGEEMDVFREALHRLVAAISGGEPIAAKDFGKVRSVITEAVGVAEIARQEEVFLWTADVTAPGLGTVLTRVALSAHDML